MKYLALLRGVNVGGNNKVPMKELKAVFEAAGMSSVRTYINSGNVIFNADAPDRARLVQIIEEAIEARFGFPVRILLRDAGQIRDLIQALPSHWKNNETTKCDVLFLWDEADDPSVLERLNLDPEIDDARYFPGAVAVCVERKDATRSRLIRVVGTPLYQQMTIRNCNTARKLLELMED
jgi:uncharacterized protein (DUF1697 family)